MRAKEPWVEASAEMVARRVKKARRGLKAARAGGVEGVHQLRSSLRKLRVALEIVDETRHHRLFPTKARRRLDALFDALGELRDVDVLAARVEGLARSAGLHAGVPEDVYRTLRHDRRRKKKALVARLRRHPPGRFLRVLKKVSRRRAAKASDVPAHPLVCHHAGGILLRRFEAVAAFEVAGPMSLDVLHRLRIATKALHDALGLLGDAIDHAAPAIDQTLVHALDLLGRLHDHAILREFLDARRRPSRGPLRRLRVATNDDATRLRTEFEAAWQKLRAPPFRRAMLAVVDSFLDSAGPNRGS